MIKEDDLMMISDSDAFITSDLVLKPLDNLSYKAWVYWVSDNNGNDQDNDTCNYDDIGCIKMTKITLTITLILVLADIY